MALSFVRLTVWAFVIIAVLGIWREMTPHEARAAAVFTVNSHDDADDGSCDATHCSLREAINAANLTVGADTIVFSIGSGSPVIDIFTSLPPITESVLIDGNTGGATKVYLFGGVPSMLSLDGGSSTVRNLGLIEVTPTQSARITPM